jgi:hypothetical protein
LKEKPLAARFGAVSAHRGEKSFPRPTTGKPLAESIMKKQNLFS